MAARSVLSVKVKRMRRSMLPSSWLELNVSVRAAGGRIDRVLPCEPRVKILSGRPFAGNPPLFLRREMGCPAVGSDPDGKLA